MEETRKQGECELAGVSARDVVDAFGNDTQLTLAMGKWLLTEHVMGVAMERPVCADLESAEPRLSHCLHTGHALPLLSVYSSH
jgi:hypothetical protein